MISKEPSLIEKIWANLYFLFFTAQILSPMIDGKTIYLEIIIACLNPLYLNWLIKKLKLKTSYIVPFFSIVVFSLCGHIEVSIKLLLIVIEVTCLVYLNERKLWYILRFFFVSFIFLIVQQVFMVVDPYIAAMIGPSNISKIIWGDYATATFTNFYSIVEFGLPRTSGLSREAGFFASYMSILFLEEYCRKIEFGILMSTKYKIMYAVAFICSFSKVSLILIIQLLAIKFKKIFAYLPYGIVLIMFFLVLTLLVNENIAYLTDEENITFLHRFGGYISIFNIDIVDFLFGIDISKIGDIYSRYIELDDLKLFAGLSGFIIQNGFVSTMLFFVALYILGLNSLRLLLLLLGTVTTSPETMQNFIVLQYFILYKYKAFTWRHR